MTIVRGARQCSCTCFSQYTIAYRWLHAGMQWKTFFISTSHSQKNKNHCQMYRSCSACNIYIYMCWPKGHAEKVLHRENATMSMGLNKPQCKIHIHLCGIFCLRKYRFLILQHVLYYNNPLKLVCGTKLVLLNIAFIYIPYILYKPTRV